MSELVRSTLTLVASAVGVFLLHLALLKLEALGHIYYWKKKANLRSVGTALMQIQGLLEPAKRYVIEAKQEVAQQDQQGGPPTPEDFYLVVGPMPEKSAPVPPKSGAKVQT